MGRVELGDQLEKELGSLWTDYLSLSLGVKYKSSAIWDRVEEKYGKILAI